MYISEFRDVELMNEGRSRRRERTSYGRPVRNTILLEIPEQEFRIVQPALEFVNLDVGMALQREGGHIEAAYFLNRGIASMLVSTSDGKSVEVGISGYEDMIGLPLAGGLTEFTHTVLMQIPGDGFRIEARAMERIVGSLPDLQRLLVRRLAVRSILQAQNAGCNRLHDVKKRIARWLLVTHDRLDSHVIITTHDSLSKMVGTDRATVTVAIADLEQIGIIARGRASISITNRRKLERLSCECYALFKRFNPELGLRD